MTSTKEFLEAEQHFLTGENFYLHHLLGCQFADGSYTFRVWAPNAQQVWLQGDFNQWDDSMPMNKRDSGIWEISVDQDIKGQLYKYKIRQADGTECMKFDPMAIRYEARPNNAAEVYHLPVKKWKDGLWKGRQKR